MLHINDIMFICYIQCYIVVSNDYYPYNAEYNLLCQCHSGLYSHVVVIYYRI